MEWFWCTEHGTVEEATGCRPEVRLGPYPDRAAAEHAQWDAEDQAEDRTWGPEA